MPVPMSVSARVAIEQNAETKQGLKDAKQEAIAARDRAQAEIDRLDAELDEIRQEEATRASVPLTSVVHPKIKRNAAGVLTRSEWLSEAEQAAENP